MFKRCTEHLASYLTTSMRMNDTAIWQVNSRFTQGYAVLPFDLIETYSFICFIQRTLNHQSEYL